MGRRSISNFPVGSCSEDMVSPLPDDKDHANHTIRANAIFPPQEIPDSEEDMVMEDYEAIVCKQLILFTSTFH
jgi:hypothetical protein